MKFEMATFGSDGVLAGATPGQAAFLAMLKDTSTPREPSVVFLDFAGVQVATGSFLREAVVAYRNHVRGHIPALYPVVANATQSVIDELVMLLELRSDALVICTLDQAGAPKDSKIIGVVDGKQQEALLEVIAQGATDAPTLAKATPEQKPTVWNNRLSALVEKGLVIEDSSAKTKRYRPVLKGLTYGR